MLAFSNDYYGFIFRVTQSVELFCTYIVCLVELDNNSKKVLMNIFTNMFTEVVKDSPGIASDLFEGLNYLVNTMKV